VSAVVTYILRRAIQLPPVLLVISTLVFFVFRVIPGDAATARLGENADPDTVARVRQQFGLDQPLYVQSAVQMRFLRSSLLDVIAQDYVRTAYAKGLAHRVVVVGHALKNALIPFVTVVGLEFAYLLGGLVVVEQIFAWPGVGWLMVQSITQRDVAVVQGAVLLVAIGFVVINLLVDVAYAYLDPRIHDSYRQQS
jgi:ABC-type dipeptide/oligopeptide/nickel transport system permease component